MTDAGQKIREQYADTGGFTDHVFAVTALLGFQFIPPASGICLPSAFTSSIRHPAQKN